MACWVCRAQNKSGLKSIQTAREGELHKQESRCQISWISNTPFSQVLDFIFKRVALSDETSRAPDLDPSHVSLLQVSEKLLKIAGGNCH